MLEPVPLEIESSMHLLLMQGKTKRAKIHSFVSVSLELSDALSVLETLSDALCEFVVLGSSSISVSPSGLLRIFFNVIPS